MIEEKISVVVPCFNIETCIKRTVQSICSQTYQNIEIVLVDDGSTDSTLEVLHNLELEDERIRVIHKENGGVTRARLAGVEASTGEWIGFVDGDDTIEPDMYENLLNNAHLYQADISHCGYQMVFPNRVDFYYNTGRLAEQDNLTGLKDLLDGSFIEPGLCNKLFHRTLFHSLLHTSLMDLSIKNNEDLLMNYYLFQNAKKSVYEDFCPYHYIIRANSATKKALNENQLYDPIKVTKILITETTKQPELQLILKNRLLNQLIRVSCVKLNTDLGKLKTCKANAQNELRKEMHATLTNKEFGIKLKMMVLIAALMPDVYGLIHCIYEKITGLDKKYSLE